MIDKKRVVLGESVNDGHNVFLHYDAETGCYLAFGHSAYYVAMFIHPKLSFSKELQLPVAQIDKGYVQLLQSNMMLIEHSHNHSFHLYTQQDIDNAEYERWVKRLNSAECRRQSAEL